MSTTILTASGTYFDLLNPDPWSIKIIDIAHALSNLCRFTGHTADFYSVAEHSMRVAMLVPPEHKLEALLHDAAEAYLGDVSSPLKALLPDYQRIEHAVDQAIRQRFDLPLKPTPCVKYADLVMLATERRDLMVATDDKWPILTGIDPAKTVINPFSDRVVYPTFLHNYQQYYINYIKAAA